MEEDEIVAGYGLRPEGAQLDEIRELLAEVAAQGYDADTLAMKVYCVQLFNHGSLEDVLPIWRAKKSGWDAQFSIDVQLLCGAGLEATKAFLAGHPAPEARRALDYLVACEEAGDFEDFSVMERTASYDRYYT